MKAEHRHQLQTNVLADRMGKMVETVKTTPRSTSYMVGGIIVLLVVIVIGWQFYANAEHTERSSQWTALDLATHDPDAGRTRLQHLIEESPNSIAARSARFILTRQDYLKAQQDLNSLNREAAVKLLQEAKESYAKLATESTDMPVLAQEAMMGVAKIEETLMGVPKTDSKEMLGSYEQALKAYQELAAKHPGSVLGREAKEKVKDWEADPEKVKKLYAEYGQLINPRPSIQLDKP